MSLSKWKQKKSKQKSNSFWGIREPSYWPSDWVSTSPPFFSREQELSNLLQQQDYVHAIGLAITLDQPFRVLTVLTGESSLAYRWLMVSMFFPGVSRRMGVLSCMQDLNYQYLDAVVGLCSPNKRSCAVVWISTMYNTMLPQSCWIRRGRMVLLQTLYFLWEKTRYVSGQHYQRQLHVCLLRLCNAKPSYTYTHVKKQQLNPTPQWQPL